MDVEVWSDIVCPWCYLGNVRFKKALAQSDQGASVNVRTRSFELDPFADKTVRPNLERLAEKYVVTPDEARAMEERLAGLCEQEGVPFELERPTANSFDLHRAVWLAREFGAGEQLFDRLQTAHFGEGADVFDHELLTREAVAADVPEERIESLLSGEEYTEEVRADEALARQLGVNGVPFMVLDGRYALPGAVSVEQYAAALNMAIG